MKSPENCYRQIINNYYIFLFDACKLADVCCPYAQKILPALSIHSYHLLAHLSVLSQVALCSVQSYEDRSDEVTNFILNELILKNRHEVGNWNVH